MKIISGAKGKGKTKRIIQNCLNDSKGILIVHDSLYLSHLIDDLKFPANKIFTISSFLRWPTHKKDYNLYIDNLDLVLPLILKQDIIEITVTLTDNLITIL